MKMRRWNRMWSFVGCVLSAAVLWAGQAHAADADGVLQRDKSAFGKRNTSAKYAPDRPFQIEHLRLALRIWPRQKRIAGDATLTIHPIGRSLDTLKLDAIDLQVKKILLAGKPVRWQMVKKHLLIFTGKPLAVGKRVKVQVFYAARPRLGLHFVLPSKAYPKRGVTVFSQGEARYHRYWFPSHDSPNMRFTSETLITVPKALQVIANGRLLQRKVSGAWATFHHKISFNHVNYLLSLVIGKFALYKQSWQGIPILSYVQPDRLKDAPLSFKNTAFMMGLFSKLTGYRYPYSKYAQTTVPDFTSGGMENITATTLTINTLHDARGHLNRRSDGLVAHELAHQWFGDLLTCKDWSHIWLNESFATYFAQLYYEHKEGKDAFAWSRLRSLGWYFWASSRYKRPIQTNYYRRPGVMFDSHSYPKGAAVLHMIRRKLGDALWHKALALYVKTHAHGLVETSDLRRAIEKVSGRSWVGFFDQWIRQAGHPVVAFSWRYDRRYKLVHVTLKQKQKGALFSFGTTMRIVGRKAKQSVRVRVSRRVQTMTIPFGSRPLFVEYDPQGDILQQIKAKKGAHEWKRQLTQSTSLRSRIRAARGLRKFGSTPGVLQALSKILGDEGTFYGLRTTIAGTLRGIGSPEACKALAKAVSVKEARVRAAVVGALAACREMKPLALLVERMRKDLSYEVRRQAVAAIGRLRHKRTFALLVEALKLEGDLGRIKAQALSSLASLEEARALPILRRYVAPTSKNAVLQAAMTGYARLANFLEKKGRGPRELLIPFLKASHWRIQASAMRALAILGDPKAIPALRRFAQRTPRQGFKEAVPRTIKKIRRKQSRKDRFSRLQRRINKLKRSQRRFQRKFKRLYQLHFEHR